MIEEADTSKDGMVDYAEFLQLMEDEGNKVLTSIAPTEAAK